MTEANCSHGLPFEHACTSCVEEALERVEAHKPKSLKEKKCKQCRKPFIPRSPLQVVCGPLCGEQYARANRVKKERKETRKRLDAIATLPELKKKAQAAFNGFIRARDRLAGHPCISSGRPLDWSGNAVDAGHYRSVGAAPHLRFNEDNAHGQSKADNQYKAGNVVEYRINLIKRIGLARVEALEADNTPRNYTRQELIEIAAHYRKKAREMKG